MPGSAFERKVSQFVDDEKFRFGVPRQSFFQFPFALRPYELRQQRYGVREEGRVAPFDGLSSERYGKVGFSYSRRTKEQEVLSSRYPSSCGQFFHLAPVDAGPRPLPAVSSLPQTIDAPRIGGEWLCGHVHGVFRKLGPVVNAGVDVWDYRPAAIGNILVTLDDPTVAIPGPKGYGE